jgi:hypothetical protein
MPSRNSILADRVRSGRKEPRWSRPLHAQRRTPLDSTLPSSYLAANACFSHAMAPALDGRELSLRLGSFHSGLPILFLSGETDSEGEALRGARCLKKPLTPQELVAAIKEVIDSN